MASLFIPKRIIPLAAVLMAAVVLLVGVYQGQSAGKARAQSVVVLANAQSAARGLGYFFGDQERYPSAEEFSQGGNLLQPYFSAFPPAELIGGSCAQSFSYQRPSLTTFKLSFCLPAATGNFSVGWNQITPNQ